MRPLLGYAAASVVLVSGAVALMWPWLDPAGRTGVLRAAAVALPVQIAAFGLLVRGTSRGATGFLAAWTGGTLARMVSVLAGGAFLLRAGGAAPLATLLALAGFFFALLLLEPLYWGGGKRAKDTHDPDLRARS